MMDRSSNRQFEQKSKKLVKAFASSESGKTRVLLVGADWYYMLGDLSCAFSDVESLHTLLRDMFKRVNREDDLILTCLASQHDKEIHSCIINEYNNSIFSCVTSRHENEILARIIAEYERKLERKEEAPILCKFKEHGVYKLATWKVIKYCLEKLYKDIKEEDSVLIYFTGHGAEVNGESFFLPLDAILEDYGDTINVKCAISINEIIKELSKRKAKCKWLVVDTCRTVMNGIEAKQETGEFLKPKDGVVVFQSCSSGESSIAKEYSNRDENSVSSEYFSVFSKYFFDAFKRKDDIENTSDTTKSDVENKGYTTISDVWKYVSDNIQNEKGNFNNRHYLVGYCKQTPEQTPDCNIKDFEDVVICGFPPLSKTELENARKELKKAQDLCDKGEYEAGIKIAYQVMERTDRGDNAKEIWDEARKIWDKRREIGKSPQDEYQKSSEKNKNERSSFLIGKVGSRKTIDVRGQKFTFCFCPPGTFMMGSPVDEKGHKKNERQHEVKFTKGFWMLESEVTQGQWEAIMKNNPSRFKEPYLPNRPVDSVSLVDCRIFIDKLNELSPMQDGFEFKLPTESQWEYACRAGSQEAYSGELDEMGWYYNNEGKTTREVKGKKPNAWGLYDMHGNLYEWCSDGYEEDYPSGPVTDHRTPSSSFGQYVNRGGKYSSDAVFCRSASRGHNAPWEHDEGLGVRIILESSDQEYTYDEFDKETAEIFDSDDVLKSGSSRTIKLGRKSWVFRYCEPGVFDMGSPDDEKGRCENETRRQVSITHGFWMLETPVTQDLYYAVRRENPSSHQGKEIFNGKEEFVEYPVENVNWNDSRLFAKHLNTLFEKELTKLSSDGKLKFRLPTEAEWEYACRAGEKGAYAGDLEKMGWYKNNSSGHTHRVKLKDPNNWGLYDMHGNVGEWCLDMYSENLNKDLATDTITLPIEDTRERVVRSGGGFAGDAFSQRSASRTGASTNEANPHIGFRLVLSFFDPEGNSGNGAEAESNH